MMINDAFGPSWVSLGPIDQFFYWFSQVVSRSSKSFNQTTGLSSQEAIFVLAHVRTLLKLLVIGLD